MLQCKDCAYNNNCNIQEFYHVVGCAGHGRLKEKSEKEEKSENGRRLIDANALKKDFKRLPIMSNWGEAFLPALIDRQPTAYDVDKVVAQLEELSQEHEYKVVGDPDTYSEYNEAWGDCADRAIEIVKRGGVDGRKNDQKT